MAAGDLLSLKICDSTIIDADGDGFGYNGNGWLAELVIEGMAADGAFDASLVTMTFSDPGFDAGASSVTRQRVIHGATVLSRQRPNNEQLMIDAVGGNVRIRFVLREDIVYQGSAFVSATIGAGAYSGASSIVQASHGGAPATLTNASTRTYPRALVHWLNMPHELVSAATYPVELVVVHRHGMNGRMAAAVAFQAHDDQGNASPVVIAGSTSVSSLITQGFPPECFKASVPIGNLTQDRVCTVNAKVYPWIGDNVLDLSVDGVALPSPNADVLLPFVCDVFQQFAPATAFVKNGASGGAVGLDLASARATPFGTVAAAVQALGTYNAVNTSHHDVGGSTVYLMDANGGPASYQMTDCSGVPSGDCWWNIAPDPDATGLITWTDTTDLGQAFCPGMLRFSGIKSFVTGSNHTVLFPSGVGDIATDNCMITSGGLFETNGFCRYAYHRNLTDLAPAFSNIAKGLFAGVVVPWGVSGGFQSFSFIGCDIPGVQIDRQENLGGIAHLDASMVINTRFARCDRGIDDQPYVKGTAFVQYLADNTDGNLSTACTWSADGTIQPIDNFIEMYGSCMGERGNHIYCDEPATRGVLKRGVMKFNVWDNWNCKSHMFTGAGTRQDLIDATGRVGNTEALYNVGSRGNMSLYGSKEQNAPGVGINFGEQYLGAYWPSDCEYNASLHGILPTYVNTAPGTQVERDFRLTGQSNSLYNRVASGEAALAFDPLGIPRRNDGTGAGGFFERDDARQLTLVGPSSGTVGNASSMFTVSADGHPASIMTVTPHDGGAGGVFTPASFHLSPTVRTAVFNYRPAHAGLIAITLSNSGGLANPAEHDLTAAPLAYTATVPANGSPGLPVSPIVIAAQGTLDSAVMVALSDDGAGGIFKSAGGATITTVSLYGVNPSVQIKYVPAAAGTVTLQFTNAGDLVDPVPTQITVVAPTAHLAGPASGQQLDLLGPYTLSIVGTLAADAAVTLDAGGKGTFNSAAGGHPEITGLTLAGLTSNPSAQFYFTPTAVGPVMLTLVIAGLGSVTLPLTVSYQAPIAADLSGLAPSRIYDLDVPVPIKLSTGDREMVAIKFGSQLAGRLLSGEAEMVEFDDTGGAHGLVVRFGANRMRIDVNNGMAGVYIQCLTGNQQDALYAALQPILLTFKLPLADDPTKFALDDAIQRSIALQIGSKL